MELGLSVLSAWLLDHMTWVVIGLFVAFIALEMLGNGFGKEADVSFSRMVTNFGLGALTAGLSLLIPLSTIAAAVVADKSDFGLFNLVDAPWWIVFLAAVLSRTFANYWLHRAFHAVPWLWRIHRVHHSDTHFDLTLALRTHPFDYLLRIALFVGLTFALGLPVWAVVIGDLILTAANYWEHVDARLNDRIDRLLGGVLVTPNIHRVHHSAWREQTDSNFGGGLVIWDRLFGTFRSPQIESVERLGLGDVEDARAQNVWKQLALPFMRAEPRAPSATSVQ